MRILHTSDWHLGRALHQQDLHPAQTTALAQIVKLVQDQAVDVVIIAGDVFDRAVPPVEAVTLFVQTLQQLSKHSVVVVTSGNHDSAIRLGYGAELFRDGIHIATAVEVVGTGIDVSVDGLTARIYPIPFLVPDHAREVLKAGQEPLERSHEAVLKAAIDRIHADLHARPDAPDATIVVAHAFVTGAHASDSERDISVGGVDNVNASIFEGLDYVALGHLHGPQQVRGPESTIVRYCGSPLRYSFSEAEHLKSVTLLDVTKADSSEPAVINVRTAEIDQPRPMATLTGTFAEIMDEKNQTEHAQSWLQVTVTDDARPHELTQTVRSAYPHALVIQHRPENSPSSIGTRAEALAAMSPVEIASDFIEAVANRPATNSETDLLRQVYEVARTRVES